MWQKVKNYYHLGQAILANLMYGFPSRKLIVIGVTGTDGKTTTTNLIYHILKSSGKKAAMISTIGAAIGEKTLDIGFHVTTPSSFSLQRYIKKAVDENNKYLVLETTSHALDQYRVWGISYNVGVITNVTHEHLDYHKTYDNYLASKFRLLQNSKICIVNADDESYDKINSKLKNQKSKLQFKNNKLITYGLKQDTDINPKVFPLKTQLVGMFNKYNSLAAVGVCKSLGLSDADISKALLSFKAPVGRQEIVYDKDFTVMIDFAHTPNSFYNLLPELSKEAVGRGGRLIHIFGAAGKRDFTKRPEMGKASATFADITVLTSEDPRDENIHSINKQILEGMKKFEYKFVTLDQVQTVHLKKYTKYIFEIPDRREAIEFAISIAQKGDYLVITGKSHEKSMNCGRGEEPWDEFAVVKEALKKRITN